MRIPVIVLFLFHLPPWFSGVLVMNSVLGFLSCYIYFAVRPSYFMTGVTGFGEKEFMSCAELSSLELCCLKEKVLSHSLEVYYYYYSQKPSNIKNMLQSIYYDNFWELWLCSRFRLFITSNSTPLWSPIPKALLSIFLTVTEIPSCKTMKQFLTLPGGFERRIYTGNISLRLS